MKLIKISEATWDRFWRARCFIEDQVWPAVRVVLLCIAAFIILVVLGFAAIYLFLNPAIALSILGFIALIVIVIFSVVRFCEPVKKDPREIINWAVVEVRNKERELFRSRLLLGVANKDPEVSLLLRALNGENILAMTFKPSEETQEQFLNKFCDMDFEHCYRNSGCYQHIYDEMFRQER
jgi:hypothetical protein